MTQFERMARERGDQPPPAMLNHGRTPGTVQPSTSASNQSSNMGVGAAVLIAVAGCVLLVIGALYVRCVSRRFNATVARNSPPKITGLGSPSIAALPTVAYQRPREDRGASRTLCSVCLGAMSEGELVRVLPACAHVFHVDCIDAWLRARATCPVCRSDLKLSHLVDTGESEIPPPPPSPPPLSSTSVV